MTGLNTTFQKTARHLHIKTSTIEAHSPCQSPQERQIGELRQQSRDKRRKKNITFRLWDFNARTGRTGAEAVTRDTPDISEWINFDLWHRVWYWDSPHKEDNPLPGRWLQVSHYVGSAMCYWVIGKKCKVISRTTVQHITDSELKTDEIKAQFVELDKAVASHLDNPNFVQEGLPDM
eukprot:10562302-Ditylum_brightwellii.AAC.1